MDSGVIIMLWDNVTLKRKALYTAIAKPLGYWGGRWKTDINYHFEDYQIYYGYNLATPQGRADFEYFLANVPSCVSISMFSYHKVDGINVTSTMNSRLANKASLSQFTNNGTQYYYVGIGDEYTGHESYGTTTASTQHFISNIYGTCFKDTSKLQADEQVINLYNNSTKNFEKAGMKLYPNPSINKIVNVEMPTNQKAELSIFSATGQLIKTYDSNSFWSLNLTNLSAGTYVVKIDAKDGVYSQILMLE